jgi:hypothetical protein
MPPRLVAGPKLVATGTLAYSDPGPCPDGQGAKPNDAIGALLAKDAVRSGACR